ncbi:energy transducer TonB [Neptuniibacter sp.]|uniref:energy transducer TonB n=1 Tax=Neptuniibacter sp. TaxID=1962643 RepID=UPI002620AC76|nr:energy transducer TonB [Neptuniibacter sp.]MCP4595434.1 energy transducer TonB [Neptuniibacter sp.]
MVTSPQYQGTPRPPKYPRKAQRKRQEGTVLVRVLVDAFGQNEDVVLHKSSGYESLDEAALKAVTGWQIKPAVVAGKAVSSWVEIPVVFSLR